MNFRILFLGLMIIVLNLIACDVGGGKKFIAKPTSIKFGEVYLGEEKEIELILHSNSDSVISITNIEINGSNTFSVTPSGASSILVHPSNNFSVKVKYLPTAKTQDSASLVITSSIELYPNEIEITGTGIGYAKINVIQEKLEFKSVVKNQTLTKGIDIESFGINDLEITNFKISGADAGLFSIQAGGTTPKSILPGATHTVNIKFSPTTGGTFDANLEIEHNGINELSPIQVPLTGEGLDYEPKIALNRTSPWDFGSLSTCFVISEKVKVQNIGVDPLYIRDIQLTNGIEFTIKAIYVNNVDIKNVPYTLLPGKELEVEVEFAPQANNQYNDSLKIDHNAVNASNPLTLDIEGFGNPITTRNFQYIGSPEQFIVLAGVYRVKFELWGAEGGGTYPSYTGTDPGKGGYVVGFMNVTPGDTFEIYVGGKGQDGVLGAGGLGGWNGGGFGGSYPGPQQFGGGGGGASDIRFGGSTYYDRIIVAGGGGGPSAHMANCDGGSGGGLIAGNGLLDGTYKKLYCGGGGYQDGGGTPGCGYAPLEFGSFGKGGNSYDIHGNYEFCGGGGGAGWYGGGASSEGGAGGGSSYTHPQKIFNFQHQQGVRSGNGQIKITY